MQTKINSLFKEKFGKEGVVYALPMGTPQPVVSTS